MKVYLHALKGSCGAPSGCIGVSDKPHHEDLAAIDGPAALIAIDPHGVALSDKEADDMAVELCRRWNAFVGDPDDGLNGLIESYVTDVCEYPDRTSPDEQPDMLLIHPDELRQLLRVFTEELRALDQGE